MKKQLSLSILFLMFFQIILFGQVIQNASSHEVSIYSGVSIPQGKYAELEAGRKTVGRAMMGTFTDGSYTYYIDDEMVGLNFTVGYNHNPVDGEYIVERFTSPNPSITSEISYTDWGMFYFMPGLSFRIKGDNQIKFTASAGLLHLTEAADISTIRYGSNWRNESMSEYRFTINFAVKTGVSMHYYIAPKLYVQVRGGLLYSKTKRDTLYTRIETDAGVITHESTDTSVKTLNLLTLNAALGLSYDF